MSFDGIKWAFTQILSSQDKLVLLVIANRINQKTGECFPSMGSMAEDTGLSRRSILRSIDNLNRLNLIHIEPRFLGNTKGKRSHIYRLNMNAKPKLTLVTGSHMGGDSQSQGLCPPVTYNLLTINQ
ncbi:Helix-turn-helix domain containing protein [uncultured Caudovirales phage]|uniref:Helix-turn-helix domain containing protein n=1 Tax=uncultured Caudovirales phage TaxID=2100421 RepID=A0A6J7WTY4_9CAUD|nr:Helix-turn-helix domain containing protein [uncultured Caudovirales phage]